MDVNTLFKAWKSLIQPLEDKYVTPYQYDASLRSGFEWDLPISPNGCFFLVFPPLTKFKPKSEPLYEERRRSEAFYKKHQQKIYGMGWSRKVILKLKGFKSRSFQGA